MIAACTIVSRNYLHFARVLCRSFLDVHPGARFFVLLVDTPAPGEAFEGEPFELIPVETLGIPGFRSIAFKYDVLELNTNVKPSFLKWLVRSRGIERVVYLDPDVFVYSPLAQTYGLLESADVVLTPHILSPIRDDKRPSEQDFLLSGVFNLGFIGVSNRKPAVDLLDWWEARCLERGFNEQRAGLFVDQKWASFFPCMSAAAAIQKDPGCNVAYWNLHERRIERRGAQYWVNCGVNGESMLKFFHFSGIDLDDIGPISRYQNRFTLRERPDLAPLFEDYARSVRGERAAGGAAYAFGSFSDGTAVSPLARRVYACSMDKFPQNDPFDAAGPFLAFARKAGLLSGSKAGNQPTSLTLRGDELRLRLAHRLLRLALRILGADRYALLMRFLGHISIVRNQRPIFWRD